MSLPNLKEIKALGTEEYEPESTGEERPSEEEPVEEYPQKESAGNKTD